MERSRQASHLASRSYRGGIPDLAGGDGFVAGAGAGAGGAAGAAAAFSGDSAMGGREGGRRGWDEGFSRHGEVEEEARGGGVETRRE